MGLGFAFLLLGLFRYSQTIPKIDERHLVYYLGQRVNLSGVVDELPRGREKTIAYVIRLQSHEGKLLLTADALPSFEYGDRLSFSCVPEELSEFEQYARREGVQASCAFPEYLTRLDGAGGSRLRGTLFAVRRAFDERLERLFPDPYGGLLAGILYGDTSGLSAALKDAFRKTGIAHITALSGYNITIISFVLLSGLIYAGLTRRQALPVAVLLILAFVLATGAEASVVRASIMGFMLMGAKSVGRLSKPRNALSLAGAVMLTVNPRLLRFDLGFLLSFLATIALFWCADDFAKRTLIRKLPKLWNIREAAGASCAALAFTTPLLLYVTGMLGPFSLLVNILVVPAVPATMALGALGVGLDFLWHPFGLGLAFLARAPLAYIISIAEWFARFGAFHIKLTFGGALLLFIGIVYIIYVWKRTKPSAQMV